MPRSRLSGAVLTLTLFSHVPSGFAQEPHAPPAYTQVRWDEDYSYLKDANNRSDPLDAIKYIPLGDNSYLSLGGQVRYRYELFNNTNFGSGFEDNNGYSLIRMLAHADLHLGDNFRFFVQGKSALIENGGIGPDGAPRLSDADEFDLQQAFADFILPISGGGKQDSLTVRFGRQEMVYGAQRMIGVSDFTNAERTFDGLRFSLVTGANTLDLFWVRPVDIEKTRFNNGDPNASFAGAYDTLHLPDLIAKGDHSTLEGYFLALNRTNGQFAQNAGGAPLDEDRYTVGGRFYTAPTPFDFDIESAYQFGQFGSGNISAWMFSTEGGYTLENVALKPRLSVGLDYASGDHNPNDPDLQTYNPLFNTAHPYNGYADVVGRQNIIDAHCGVEFQLLENARYAKKLSLLAEPHFFWRADTSDALYNKTGGASSAPPNAGIARAADGSDSSYVGSELDFILNWQMDRHLSGYIGYSHFFAGNFINETGPDRDIDFVYAALVYTF